MQTCYSDIKEFLEERYEIKATIQRMIKEATTVARRKELRAELKIINNDIRCAKECLNQYM